ncbi:MAG: hypothetical protein RLZZ323_1561 [Bacteroidota bacterium]|jgi:hypothetical protein
MNHFEDLHLSLQYFTSSQTFSHFLRQANGFWQTIQILVGRFCFFTPRIFRFIGITHVFL